MRKPKIFPSMKPNCVWLHYPNGEQKEVIDPEIAERDRLEMKKLYQEKSGDYSY